MKKHGLILILVLISRTIFAATTVAVSPGANPTVTLNIPSPGTPDSITVTPASGYAFAQAPSIANNPTGLWSAGAGNTFSVVFLNGNTPSADVTIVGKLVPVGDGGDGAGPPPPTFDFSLPGLAILTGQVGAVFEEPSEIWQIVGDTINCRVRFTSSNGAVTAVTSTYTWVGDNLSDFSTPAFANGLETFTYKPTMENQHGQIQGHFTGITAGAVSGLTTDATSLLQKTFKVVFVSLQITLGKPIAFANQQQNGNLGMVATASPIAATLKLVPEPAISIDGRFAQFITSTSLAQFAGHKEVWSKAGRQQDATNINTFNNNAGTLTATSGDTPYSTPRAGFLKADRKDDPIEVYIQLKLGSRSWRTFGKNSWKWNGTITKNTAAGTVVGTSSVASEIGAINSDVLPDPFGDTYNSGTWVIVKPGPPQ